jgi:hypothetical protein
MLHFRHSTRVAPVVPDIIGEALVLSTLQQQSQSELVVLRVAN